MFVVIVLLFIPYLYPYADTFRPFIYSATNNSGFFCLPDSGDRMVNKISKFIFSNNSYLGQTN